MRCRLPEDARLDAAFVAVHYKPEPKSKVQRNEPIRERRQIAIAASASADARATLAMNDDEAESSDRFLSRWSRRKHEAARAERAASEAALAPSRRRFPAPTLRRPLRAPPRRTAPLPPVESLTIDSDFAPFLKPGGRRAVKRAALTQLFSDPRFNVMDGLDIYIDDYIEPDPIRRRCADSSCMPAHLRSAAHARSRSRRIVEDVPPAKRRPTLALCRRNGAERRRSRRSGSAIPAELGAIAPPDERRRPSQRTDSPDRARRSRSP